MNIRLDQYLVENNLAPDIERAKAVIMAGIVYINNEKADKAGMTVKPLEKVEV
ncbi:MAG: S4 domain-containing protein, partial [Oscillospiraceae bacterium]